MADEKKELASDASVKKVERKGGYYVEYVVFSIMVLIVSINIFVNMTGASFIGSDTAREKVIMGFATLIFLFAPRVVFAKLRFRLPAMILLLIEIFVFLGMYLGEILDAFYAFIWWDILLHMMSGILLSMMAFLVIYPLYMQRPARAYAYIVFMFALMFAIGAGGIWELLEYTIDHVFGTNMQRSGLDDTMKDLLMDTIGALIASLTAYFYIIKKRRSRVIEDIVRDYYNNNRYLFEVETDEELNSL